MEKNVKGPVLSGTDFRIVKNNGELYTDAPLLFTFSNFKFFPINIDGRFNNYFETEEQYIRKISVLMGKALPLLSREQYSLFNDVSKTSSLHIHKLHGKEEILKEIFIEYKFNEESIDNFIEGAEIYQLEVPNENGATRIIFERIDNLISFLFMDPNHHIYMNQKLVDKANSLFFEYCPIAQKNLCDRLDYFGTCFAFEYLDENKYKKSYENSYSPLDE